MEGSISGKRLHNRSAIELQGTICFVSIYTLTAAAPFLFLQGKSVLSSAAFQMARTDEKVTLYDVRKMLCFFYYLVVR